MKALHGLCLLILAPQAAHSSDLAALEAAISDAESRLEGHETTRFSFRKTIEQPDVRVVLRYDPSQKPPWSVIGDPVDTAEAAARSHNEALIGAETSPDRDALMTEPRKLMTQGDAQFLREENGAWVYNFDLKEGVEMAGGGQKADITSYLKGEIFVDKDSRQLSGMRFYAPEPFKPAPVAKVKEMNVRIDFAPVDGGEGPLVMTREATKVSGSAMFQDFSEQSTATYSGFEEVEAASE